MVAPQHLDGLRTHPKLLICLELDLEVREQDLEDGREQRERLLVDPPRISLGQKADQLLAKLLTRVYPDVVSELARSETAAPDAYHVLLVRGCCLFEQTEQEAVVLEWNQKLDQLFRFFGQLFVEVLLEYQLEHALLKYPLCDLLPLVDRPGLPDLHLLREERYGRHLLLQAAEREVLDDHRDDDLLRFEESPHYLVVFRPDQLVDFQAARQVRYFVEQAVEVGLEVFDVGREVVSQIHQSLLLFFDSQALADREKYAQESFEDSEWGVELF